MFTLDNTTGYTQKQCDDLNAQFAAEFEMQHGTDDYPGRDTDWEQEEKSFADLHGF